MSEPGLNAEARARAREAGELGGRLAGLSLRRQVLVLATWPFLEQILGFMVSTVDLVLAGRMVAGTERIAIMDALGLGGYVAWLMMILQGAVGTGVMALVSRAAGARDQELATKGLVQGLLVGLGSGALSGLGIRLLLGLLVGNFGLSEVAEGHAMSYLNTLCWVCPVVGVMLAATYSLRAIGDTRTPFIAMVIVNLVNLVLSWLFVFGPEPFGGMGVQGLALGTVSAWAVGMFVVLGFLYFRDCKAKDDGVELSLRGARLRPEWSMMKRIIRVGAPQSLEMFGMWAIHSVTLRFVSGLGVGTLGAHLIAIRVESLSFLPGLAIGTAGAALVGQYLGAGNPRQAVQAVRMCWLYAAIFMSVLGVGFLLLPEVLVRFIVPGDGEDARLIVGLAGPLVFLCGVFQPVLATTLIMKSTLRGAGATRLVMLYSFSSMILFRGIIVPIGVTQFGLELRGIWVIMFIDVVVQAALFARVHFQGKWVGVKV
ncbi:MAG: MATE family efflux transporter [Akkermansiaceae bacterium]|nr:MATE family efflux transporter [Akkermansiaceae bacterium]